MANELIHNSRKQLLLFFSGPVFSVELGCAASSFSLLIATKATELTGLGLDSVCALHAL